MGISRDKIVELVEEGIVDPKDMVIMCAKWMSEDDCEEMLDAKVGAHEPLAFACALRDWSKASRATVAWCSKVTEAARWSATTAVASIVGGL